ncbi:glycosyltransferase family 1 protein [Polychaeton citri CBS 116435]|uniref:UDP-N-acetylglucosamine transferase subunit ALG13 n=1 Tax=Polychaeton citri CBS 116435 TaxID=1314669 RepID=A0A9P4Q1B7_9PEZI|nr:glycosyltransferase family 1 protein [Polychaeton citri CBS 116435]
MAAKTCFVTVGATASFSELVTAVLSPEFIKTLQKQGFGELLIQYGFNGKPLFEKGLQASGAETSSVRVSGFDLDKGGLGRYMRQAKTSGGVCISHAGSGTILDALRLSLPLIVVPNESLLDNHQVELAEALAEQSYVVHGKLSSLSQALEDSVVLGQKQGQWPPPNSGTHRQARGLKGVLDDEMGFLDGELGALPKQGNVFKTADVSFVQTVIGE